jgi:acyl carrier protein
MTDGQQGAVRSWLIAYFEEKAQLGDRRTEDILDANYVSEELLDSLGIVEMLGALEDAFGVWLEPEQMQDPRFCSLAGLSELIEESRVPQ